VEPTDERAIDPAAPSPEGAGPPQSELERIESALAAPAPFLRFLLLALAAGYGWLLFVRLRLTEAPCTPGSLFEPIPTPLLVAAGAATPDLAARGEWWRVGIAPFLHFDLVHVGLNLFFLHVVGKAAERLIGAAGLFAAFFAGTAAGVGAAVAAGSYAAGASAGVFGVYGAIVGAVRGSDLPRALRRSVRRRFFFTLALLAILTFAVSRVLEDAGVPLSFGFWPHAAGILGGLATGLVAYARLRRPDPIAALRSRVTLLALALFGAALAAAGLPHVLAIDRLAHDPAFWEKTAALEPRRRVEMPAFGVSLEVPIGWVKVPLLEKDAKYAEVYRPPEGGAVLEVHSVPAEGLGAPFGSPDVLLDELRRDHENRGEKVIAAPFQSLRIAGRQAWRILLRYRSGGRELEEVRYLLRGARIWMITLIGPPRFTEALGESIAKTVEIRGP
jgi:membrane associated rhomboid family serine protease